MAIPPTRALVQVIGAHKPFKTSMCIEQTISLMKMFKVEFPEVTKMNIKNTMYFKDGGFRYALLISTTFLIISLNSLSFMSDPTFLSFFFFLDISLPIAFLA